ncbi:MAG: DNA polymerase I [Burkholderiales bacterium]|nr:DNA polymerase I [Burkholderiales bacterium]
MTEKKTLLLVDGSSYLYRAFHAMPDLRAVPGDPSSAATGAIRGMVNMMQSLRKEVPADYAVCVFDAKGPTFRDDLYPAYKANRSPMPDDLRTQIEPIHQVVRLMGWQVLDVPGVEADDVIGTLAVFAAKQSIEVIVSSGDKDLSQLVDQHITIIDTMNGKRRDVAGVTAEFGVPPHLMIDFQTLVGDTVDNVPGVQKVGPKTAAKWLMEYGSIEALLANAHAIKGVVGENLRKALDWLPMGRQLVTIKTDCDLSAYVPTLPALEALTLHPPDRLGLKSFYETYGFKGLARAMSDDAGVSDQTGDGGEALATASRFTKPSKPQASDDMFEDIKAQPSQVTTKQYTCVLTWEQFDTWFEKIKHASLTAFDTETTAIDAMTAQIVGLSFSVQPGEACYIPLGHSYGDAPNQLPLDEVIAKLKPWFEDPKALKLGQHIKYDRHVMANYDVQVQGFVHASEYACEDADMTMDVHLALWPHLQADAQLAFIYDLEIKSSEALFRVERNGVLIDGPKLATQSHALGQRIVELENEAYGIAGQPFNLASPKQLGEIFFDKLGLPVVKKTATGARSTDEEVLEKLAQDYPLPAKILEHRSLSKLKGTYTDKLAQMANPKTGRVHTHYAQAVAVTGRLSSNDPNLQNIPIRTPEGRKVREAFVAPAGSVIASADYSQIELRIMAHLSDDAALLKAFHDGLDVHRATAAEVFGLSVDQVSSEQRRYAKVINFGLIYGMSAFGLAKALGIDNTPAKNYITRYFERFAGVKRYMDDTREQAKAQGYVQTVFGRRLYLPEINSAAAPRRAGAERAAINAPMQGTAADLIKMSMVKIQNVLDAEQRSTRIIMQVHDELVFEVPEAEVEWVKQEVPRYMAGVAQLKVALLAEVGVGANWDTAH